MKQVLQDLKQGNTETVTVPTPLARRGQLLIATRRSLISAGTERMPVEFGQANLLAKARSQPNPSGTVPDPDSNSKLLRHKFGTIVK